MLFMLSGSGYTGDPSYELFCSRDGDLHLSRFDAAPLIAFPAPKETDYGTGTDGRIPPRCADQWADAEAGC